MRSWIKLIVFLIIFFSATTSAKADSRSDYDFQLATYRQNYIEFSLYKADYLQNPTLDNQQRAILSAKQTIQARELAKAAYARYLISSIAVQNSGYSALDPIVIRLTNASTYFEEQARVSQQIITADDLKRYALNYLNSYVIHQRSLYYGQIANKIATLVRFQINTQDEMQAMVPRLSTPYSAPLQARLDGIPTLVSQINDKINKVTSVIIPEDESGLIIQANFFELYSSSLEEIKNMQLKLVDQLRDIDLNYGQAKI